MTTHTPSPHRFIAPPTPNTTTTTQKKSRPNARGSALRNSFTPQSAVREDVTHTRATATLERTTPAQRFVFAPPRKDEDNKNKRTKTLEIGDGFNSTTTAADAGSHSQRELAQGTALENTKPADTEWVQHTPKPRIRKLNRVESIEEARSSPPQGSQTSGGDQDSPSALESNFNLQEGHDLGAEEAVYGGQDAGEDDELLFEPRTTTIATSKPYPHKRRRISTSEVSVPPQPSPESTLPEPSLSTPTSHKPQSPGPSTTINTSTSHRFLVPPNPLKSVSHGNPLNPLHPHRNSPTPSHPSILSPLSKTTTSTSTRPSFLLPAKSPPREPMAPLPATFSPQRKNQRYISGGMAEKMLGWVIEMGNTVILGKNAAGTRAARGDRGEKARDVGVHMHLQVQEIKERSGDTGNSGNTVGNGMLLLAGNITATNPRAAHAGKEINVMLSGAPGQGTHKHPAAIQRRSEIGIRAPSWEVDVRGEKWLVAADWIGL